MKNIEIAKKYLNAAYSGDIATAKSLLDENVKLTMNGNNEISGITNGREPFFASFGKMLQLTNNTYNLDEQVEWLEGQERAILIAKESAIRNDEKFEFSRVIDYIIKEGIIKEIKIYEGDPTIADKAFSK
ncbi:nuclear transport factor 2-like protein [Aquimarina mytili]|uniref:Nuclear transport factor 2 family protein n=1 Tax=Aquimarina mytili TaxID=874423 RepID=A0A937D822_9FLAO|nr:hypothetical protein [Aquimarina mytili]MBL0686169.1 hypothetical protein [Aquimarina mytili]